MSVLQLGGRAMGTDPADRSVTVACKLHHEADVVFLVLDQGAREGHFHVLAVLIPRIAGGLFIPTIEHAFPIGALIILPSHETGVALTFKCVARSQFIVRDTDGGRLSQAAEHISRSAIGVGPT